MKRRALVIDDDVLCLNVAEEYFKDKGFDVTALTRATCLMIDRKVDSCPCDTPPYAVILTDNTMPNMTGVEFLEYLEQSNCKVPNSNKALLTGEISEEEVRRMKDLGIRVFYKPCPLEELDMWLAEINNTGRDE